MGGGGGCPLSVLDYLSGCGWYHFRGPPEGTILLSLVLSKGLAGFILVIQVATCQMQFKIIQWTDN